MAEAKQPAAKRATAKTIRNLRRIPVHLRLSGQGEKPYRVQLERRGNPGDTAEIPVACQSDTAFQKGIGVLFEVITKAELAKLTYEPQGYTPPVVHVDRPADTTVGTATIDEKGRTTSKTQITRVAPNVVGHEKGTGVTGHDAGLGHAFQTAQSGNVLGEQGGDFMPPQPTKLTIERKKG